MNNNLFIASRFIKSKKSKFFSLTTVIAIAGIAVSVAILILSLQILDGFENTIFTSAAKIDAEIKITAYGNGNLSPDKTIENEIKKTASKDFLSLEKFVSKYSVVKSRKNSDGLMIVGIGGKRTENNLKKFLVGEKFDLSSGKIIIGKEIAEKLGVKIGERITIFALRNDQIPDEENPPNIMQFQVSGIFEIGMPYYDASFGFISFDDAQKLFELKGNFSGYNLFLKTREVNKIEALAAKLRDKLPYPYFPRSIFSVHRNIFVWLELQKKPIPIALSAIVLVAMMNIIGALFLLVLRRKKTIGILRTLGFKKSQIAKIFIFQGGFISVFGIALGVVISVLLTYLQNNFQIVMLPGDIYFMDKLIIASKPFYYLLVVLSATALGVLISFVPAAFASRISPVNAIRNN